MYEVAVVKYERPYDSLKKGIELCDGFCDLKKEARVFIKPNFVVWPENSDFPKYGVITTARMIEDVVILLKEIGVNSITLGEGPVDYKKRKKSVFQILAKGLGLDRLGDKYGVKFIDVMKSKFVSVPVDDIEFHVNNEVMHSDFVINMPVLKTHSQAKVSLGIKNLKGLLDIRSRKMCHNVDPNSDLDYYMSMFLDMLSPHLTILDGIFSLERGPFYNGRAHRSNLIIISRDCLSADLVGATVLGIEPDRIPYIEAAAKRSGRKTDMQDIEIQGETEIKSFLTPYQWEFQHGESGDLPAFFEKFGISGSGILKAIKRYAPIVRCSSTMLLWVF